MNWIKWIVVVVLLAAAGWFGLSYWKKPGKKDGDFRTEQIARGDITQSVTANGQLNPVLNVQVGSQISGMIQQLNVDFNSSVTQGQVIAKLDAATYRAAVMQADAELANAKAGLELAQLNAKRAAELRKTDLISASESDKALADLHQAEAQVMLRDAALERARVDFNRCTIYAPTNGIVISRNIDVGQTVAASLSAPTLFIIANDLSRMQIDAMVSEADIGAVDVGQDVTFTVDAFLTRNFHGKITQIRNAPTNNQNVITYDTVVSVDNKDLKLKPGMTANVSIIIAQQEDVVKIPNSALRFKPADPNEKKGAASKTRAGGQSGGGSRGWGGSGGAGPGGGMRAGGPGGAARGPRTPSNTRTVYLLDTSDPKAAAPAAKPQQIKIGISDSVYTEVLEGLKEGDIVIVGQNITAPGATGAPANPFGGGGMRRF